jgi:hypothetical protein
MHSNYSHKPFDLAPLFLRAPPLVVDAGILQVNANEHQKTLEQKLDTDDLHSSDRF